ncbi:MAG: alpha/beta fold hydrolase, partial [Verrucomicrobiota bacterium]
MHYLDEGPRSDDVPLLLLHGNPTWSFFYRKIIKCLSSEKRCIAPDHIGCGLSEKPNFRNFPYDLQTHSGNLIDLLDNLGVKKVILVLHDWGGAIGLTAFRNQPEQIEKIVLLNTAAFPS